MDEEPLSKEKTSRDDLTSPADLKNDLKRKACKAINAAAFLCAVLCLAITFFAAGFFTCTATSVPTRLLASASVAEDISPYTHDELVECAVAIYEYSFAKHDGIALSEYLDTLEATAQDEGRIPRNAQGEQYRLDSAAVAHLDDCWHIAQSVRIPLAIASLLAVAASAHVGVRMGRRKLGAALLWAGSVTLVAFLFCAIAAVVNFDAFFSLFHGLFFTQGTWTFWYKSLLICSLPEGFWMGMGALWFAVTFALALLSCFVGRRLRKMR